MESNTKNKNKVVGIIILLVLILAILLYFKYYRNNSINSSNNVVKNVVENTIDTNSLIKTVDLFINNLIKGKTSEAYKQMHAGVITEENFNKVTVTLVSILHGYVSQDPVFSKIDQKETKDGLQITYHTNINFSDKNKGTLDVIALNNKGNWEIIGLSANATPEHILNK